MTTVEADGVTLGVEHFGDATAPLVLLAGGTTMLSWPDALCEALARGGRHVVRYDLRDCGASTTVDPEAPAYTLRDLAADAAGLARELDDRPAHLSRFPSASVLDSKLNLNRGSITEEVMSRLNAAQRVTRFEEFKTSVEALGGTVLEIEWLGSKVKHRVRCAEGHVCRPIPNSVQQGRGICLVCAGKDPVTAEAAFRARLDELGATLLEPKYLGSAKKHHVRCVAGHDCWPAATSVQRGSGICITCANAKRGIGQSAPAEAAFKSRLVELGATLLEHPELRYDRQPDPRPVDHDNAGLLRPGKDRLTYHAWLTAVLNSLEPI